MLVSKMISHFWMRAYLMCSLFSAVFIQFWVLISLRPLLTSRLNQFNVNIAKIDSMVTSVRNTFWATFLWRIHGWEELWPDNHILSRPATVHHSLKQSINQPTKPSSSPPFPQTMIKINIHGNNIFFSNTVKIHC